MQVFLVGGAVRDYLLGKDSKDRDFVVVGSSEQEMLDAGFSKVGDSFPVFLHPKTNEEYALARTEKKSGVGYNGFNVDAIPGTLNPALTEKFTKLGYAPEKEYPIAELMEVLQRIDL